MFGPLEEETMRALGKVRGFEINHATHGAPMLVKSNETAYPWRDTAFLSYPNTNPDFPLFLLRLDILLKDKAYKNDTKNLNGYYNYMGPVGTPNWQRFYFGDNYERLQEIKAKYDPLDVFGKPVSVELPVASKEEVQDENGGVVVDDGDDSDGKSGDDDDDHDGKSGYDDSGGKS